jgi:hypothetical protein
MVIVDRLRYQAAVILEYSDSVHPASPVDAWVEMRGTRWDTILNVAKLKSSSENDAPAFEQLAAKLPAARLRKGLEQFALERQQIREHGERVRQAASEQRRNDKA